MKRIVYTIAIGKPKFAECALGLGRSLRLIGDETERIVITDQPDYPWLKSFDKVIKPVEPFEWTMLSKLSALDRTDADQVLFIDSDCLAFQRLDTIFDYCQGKGLCVQGKAISSGDWYGNVEGHLKKHGVDWLPQFNGGMIYYERTPQCQKMIQLCYELARGAKDSGFGYESALIPEEPYVAVAIAKEGVDQNGNAHLIPDTKDFTNSATGLIGKLKLDVMANQCEYVCRRFDVKFVRPILFHASRYNIYATYWKQIDRLRALEEYESKHPFGYMSPIQKLERSINRRYLKWIRKK